MKNFGDGAGTNGAAAFTDGELGSLFHGDRVDQLNVEGDVVARHNHIDSGRKGDRAGDVGGVEEELWTIAVKEVGMTSAFFFLKDIGGGSESHSTELLMNRYYRYTECRYPLVESAHLLRRFRKSSWHLDAATRRRKPHL